MPQTYLTREEWREYFVCKWTVLVRYAMALTRNREDAEDAVQDAFESLDYALAKDQGRAIAVDENQPQEAVFRYLVAIVRNKVRDIRGKTGRIVPIPDAQDLIDPEDRMDQILTKPLTPEEELLLKSDPSLGHIAEQLSPNSKTRKLLVFFVKHYDADHRQHWPLWAAENGIDVADKTKRDTFYKLKERLRKKLLQSDIYALLSGKE